MGGAGASAGEVAADEVAEGAGEGDPTMEIVLDDDDEEEGTGDGEGARGRVDFLLEECWPG